MHPTSCAAVRSLVGRQLGIGRVQGAVGGRGAAGCRPGSRTDACGILKLAASVADEVEEPMMSGDDAAEYVLIRTANPIANALAFLD